MLKRTEPSAAPSQEVHAVSAATTSPSPEASSPVEPAASAPSTPPTAWEVFLAQWEESRGRKRPPAGIEPRASIQLSLAAQDLRKALALAQTVDIAVGARSRHFMADTSTLLAATRPRSGSSTEQLAAAEELRAQLRQLADPSRPDMGLLAAASNLLVGNGPSKDPYNERPDRADIDRFEAELERQLIYTSITADEILGLIRQFGAAIEERRQRALLYDSELARAVELARVALDDELDAAALRSLRARLYAPLDVVVKLLVVDVAEREYIALHGLQDIHNVWGNSMQATASLWADVSRLRGGWLLQPDDGNLVSRYKKLVESERARPGTRKRRSMQSFFDQMDRELQGW